MLGGKIINGALAGPTIVRERVKLILLIIVHL